jgi:hypothetical protein
MSFLSLAVPYPAVEALAGTATSFARPLLGLGVMAAMIYMFKPLLMGVLRAALLVVSPRKSLAERNARRRVKGARMINRMARDLEDAQPGLASELRWLASRGN